MLDLELKKEKIGKDFIIDRLIRCALKKIVLYGII